MPTSVQALVHPLEQPAIRSLIQPLIQRWLAAPGGHIILNNQRHGFVSGNNRYRQRILEDVAWLKLAFVSEDVHFMTPVGMLIARIAGWEQETESGPALKGWKQFEIGVKGCFRAGYGISSEAQQDAKAYLAEGIAHFLVDRQRLNRHDPRLEKLLVSTLFNPDAYR